MTVGSQLAGARRERTLSLADVTRQTKIQPWVLEALEADRLSELMSPVYVKGFLTTYARFLHLAPEPLLAQLPQPEPEPKQAALPPTAPPPMPMAIRFSRPHLHRLATSIAVTAAVIGLVVANPLRRVPWLSLRSVRLPRLASLTSVKEPIRPPPPPTLTLLATDPLELSVTAHRTTWIQVKADGKLLIEQRLPRGAKERWSAKRQFELIVARPSDVELSLNGQSISPFAIAHRGRVLITHHGITRLQNKE